MADFMDAPDEVYVVCGVPSRGPGTRVFFESRLILERWLKENWIKQFQGEHAQDYIDVRTIYRIAPDAPVEQFYYETHEPKLRAVGDPAFLPEESGKQQPEVEDVSA